MECTDNLLEQECRLPRPAVFSDVGKDAPDPATDVRAALLDEEDLRRRFSHLAMRRVVAREQFLRDARVAIRGKFGEVSIDWGAGDKGGFNTC